MAPFTTRRPSWRIVTPVLAVAVFGLAACTNSQESSDVKGTTPPVWTGTAGPSGAANPSESAAPAGDSVSVPLKDPSGQEVGKATFAKSDDHLELTVDVHGLQPGFHGLHIHQVGKCEPNSVAPAGGNPGNFLSAGGHLQVGDAHAMPASGDLTSLEVRKDGSAHLVTTTDAVTLDQISGKALIIHAGEDNFANIPNRYTQANGTPGPDAESQATGDAGARIACGVIG
ncbi:superoxide dismutase[Cu-Zn] [Nocardia macrotermitis]|uniref:Superoxide dismutase [Cu-Zn] n=1 Tax=Nocardia macrotermitis TaxID=2585198 RepID=A0A7K0DDH4_9NOCA|nr:superoxide dismutase family protein [Nocardia macrotermitis]MQY23767.1 Superoxide dismutase [Cu-Zn] [Nocardia macrotermitis]